jgi:hypothetical protein
MRRLLSISAVMLLAACAGSGIDLGSILGSPSSDVPSDIRGRINTIDVGARRIDLDVSYVNNLRDERRGSSVYWDSNTRVSYSGRDYRPENLERGDEISVRGSNEGGRYVADVITVTRNVRG